MFCQLCGTGYDEIANFCKRCGKAFTDSDKNEGHIDIFISVYITYFQNPDRFLIDLTCTVKLFFKFYDKSVQVIMVLHMVFLSQPDEY